MFSPIKKIYLQTEKIKNDVRKDEFKLQMHLKNAVAIAISNDSTNNWNVKISAKFDEQLLWKFNYRGRPGVGEIKIIINNNVTTMSFITK